MFEDFSFCLSCEQYDRGKRWCKLFNRTMPCGCQYGEDKKPRNRFEQVKAMSMEEMAALFVGKCCPTIFADKMVVNTKDCSRHFERNECEQCWNNWLKEKVDE